MQSLLHKINPIDKIVYKKFFLQLYVGTNYPVSTLVATHCIYCSRCMSVGINRFFPCWARDCNICWILTQILVEFTGFHWFSSYIFLERFPDIFESTLYHATNFNEFCRGHKSNSTWCDTTKKLITTVKQIKTHKCSNENNSFNHALKYTANACKNMRIYLMILFWYQRIYVKHPASQWNKELKQL